MTAPVKKPLCPKHAAERTAWLDYPLRLSSIQIAQIGEPNERRLRDNQKGRFQDWRDTVRFQRDLVTKACREGRGCSDEIPEVL